MPQNKSVHANVEQLKHVGEVPTRKLVERILAHGEEAREPLLNLAVAVHLLFEPEPTCWGPLHALRLLGEMPDTSIIAPLLSILPLDPGYEPDLPVELWTTEVLGIVACCGAPAVPLLWQWSDDESYNERSRGAALHALAYIAVNISETYDAIVSEALERFRQSEDRQMTALLIHLLASLGIESCYGEVMAAYRAGRVETDIISAGQARQLLLSKAEAPEEVFRLPTFWERYELYGPEYPE